MSGLIGATLLLGCGSVKADEAAYAFVAGDGGPVHVLKISDEGQLDLIAQSKLLNSTYLSRMKSPQAPSGILAIKSGEINLLNPSRDRHEGLDPIRSTLAGQDPTAVEATSSGEIILSAHFSDNQLAARSFDGEAFGPPQMFDCRWAHQFRAHPNGKWAYAACMKNTVMQFSIDPQARKVIPMTTAKITLKGGPRHLEFHPNGKSLYVMLQISSQVAVFDIDPQSGALMTPPRQIIDASQDGGKHTSSDLHMTPDGKWLYAFNRKGQDMAVFAVDRTGQLTLSHLQPMGKGEVRHWAMSANGDYLITAAKTGHIGLWAINKATGALLLRGEHNLKLSATSVVIIEPERP